MDNFAANLKEVNERRNMEIDDRILMIDPIMHKEVNNLIDADIEYKKEQEFKFDVKYQSFDPGTEVICEVCNHPVHTRCNGADCEDGQCWKDGLDFENEE